MSEALKYKLSDRPKWWLPKLFKWASLITLVVALLFGLASFITGMIETFDVMALTGTSPEGDLQDNVVIHFSEMASDAAWAALGILFYVVVFWLLAIAVDKIDELVWLNATDEDRSEIIQKRTKKKKKS